MKRLYIGPPREEDREVFRLAAILERQGIETVASTTTSEEIRGMAEEAEATGFNEEGENDGD